MNAILRNILVKALANRLFLNLKNRDGFANHFHTYL